MRLALLGKGKTGSMVAKLHQGPITIFHRSHPITEKELRGHDVIISFLPAEPFIKHWDILINSRCPVISGSTGFTWPDDFHQRLKERDASWVWSHNFSLGMQVMRTLFNSLKRTKKWLSEPRFSIHEIHHSSKIDAPSGTALALKQLIGDAQITYERKEDVAGYHSLTMDLKDESITISHEARSRAIFAEGALWAARQLMADPLPPGLHHFDQLIDRTRGSNDTI